MTQTATRSFSSGMLSRLKQQPARLLLAAGFALAFTLFGYFRLGLFSPPITSLRKILPAIAVFLALIPLFWLVLNIALDWTARRIPSNQRSWLLVICTLLSAWLTLALPFHLDPYLGWLPSHTLEITALGTKNSLSSGYKITLRGIELGETTMSYLAFDRRGAWTSDPQDAAVLTADGQRGASLHWRGRTSAVTRIFLQRSPAGGMVEISWDGKSQVIDLYAETEASLLHEQSFDLPFDTLLLSRLLATVVLLPAIYLLVCGLYLQPLRSTQPSRQPRFYWLLYALPMIAVWSVFLLIFFPGAMSVDSVIQWGQALTGHYTDHHPAFHTLSIWLLSRLWESPAIVALSQILGLSLAAAWGIKVLENHGLSRRLALLASLLFAVSYPNASMAITLWKDIPYAAAFLVFSLYLFQIAASNGKWLKSWKHAILLGLVSAVIPLLRHNGLPVVLIILPLLALIYRRAARQVVLALAVFAAAYLLVRGPLYRAVNVEQSSSDFLYGTLLGHINAHVKAGTPLLDDEIAYLNSAGITSLDDWRYNCCNILSTMQGVQDWAPLQDDPTKLVTIFTRTLQVNPHINLGHTLCLDEVVFRLSQPHCEMFTHSLYSSRNRTGWIVPNDLVQQASQLPGLVEPVYRFDAWLANHPLLFTIIWRPALYLYLTVLLFALSAVRRRNWRWLLPALPGVLQSFFLLIVNNSQAFRYQYGVYLFGLLSIFIYLLLMRNPQDTPQT